MPTSTMEGISVEGESSRTNDKKPIREFPEQELEFIHKMEGISVEGESSRTNDKKPIREFPKQELEFIHKKPIREFTRQELKFIDKQVKKYSEEAKKLKEEADRRNTSCIYRVLPRLKEINGNSLYEPNMVSIGPYYYNLPNEKLKMAENCKRKCFGSFLAKYMDKYEQTDLYKLCLQRIAELEVKIRRCYFEEFDVASILFVEMMVVDACFIIEIIHMFGPRKELGSGKSLSALAWMVPYFYRDFLLLENQIPFFVLEEIYSIISKVSISGCRSYLTYTALEFFKNGMKRFDLDIFHFTLTNVTESNQSPALHLLDLIRSSLKPFNEQQGTEFPTTTTFIHCVSKLRLAGIKVSPVKAHSFLDVKFKQGVIEMPNIAINNLLRCLLLNCVAFEQCQNKICKFFTVYATFLDCLVNTNEDVEYLRERNVIDNYLGDDSEAADFINRAGKDLVLDANDAFYLRELFENVDKHYRNSWMWKWARFKLEYFDKPWLLLSAAGGLSLVLATLLQAIVAYLTYQKIDA